MVPQINSNPITLPDDVIRARVLSWATLDQLFHLLDVERRHDPWEGQFLRNTAGNTDLINPQIRAE